MVFENCAEMTANTSAQFDNILEDSFTWNEEQQEDINALTATYTSAVDDFQLATLMPRAAWDTIDLEGEITKDEIDLTFVDNYWQAAYLTKGEAIDRIDGNLYFSFKTGMAAMGLELGDVIAIRHDSGDGALNYTPAWVTEISLNLNDFTINIGAKLYLTAAFDYHVQPIEPRLPTALSPIAYPPVLPPPGGGGGGGTGGGGCGDRSGFFTETICLEQTVLQNYYDQFNIPGTYSPSGKDII
jgi:hypothetical protein